MRRVLGARLWSWSDFPNRPAVSEPEAARILGEWLAANGSLSADDVVVVDGFWGRGLQRFPGRVVSVAHGTWRGIARATGSKQAEQLGIVQEAEYQRLPVVAVSEATRRELQELYGVKAAAVIRNGVDIEEFRPRGKSVRMKPVVVYPSNASAKGGDLVDALRRRRSDLDFRVIGAGIGQEAEAISQGDVYLSPSRTDGCAYAGLQALACGLPVVVSEVGLFADMQDGKLDGCWLGHSLPKVAVDGPTVEAWSHALSFVLKHASNMGRQARAWAERHGSLTRWEAEWRAFLGSA